MIDHIKNNSGVRECIRNPKAENREERFQEVMNTWLRYVNRAKPFACYEDVLQREYPFPRLFFQEPVNFFRDLTLDASLFHSAKLFGNQCYNALFPQTERKVLSRHNFIDVGNDQRKPQDLTSLYRVTVNSLRDKLVSNYLLEGSGFDDLHEAYLIASALLMENTFSMSPAADLDVAIPAEIFVRLATMYSRRMGMLYFTQMMGSPLYQNVYKLIDKAVAVRVDFADETEVVSKTVIIDEFAMKIVRSIDDSIIRNDTRVFANESGGNVAGNGNFQSPIGRRLRNNKLFLMNFNFDHLSETISIHEREVNGIPFIVEYKTALNMPSRYAQVSEKVKLYSGQVKEVINRLKNQTISKKQKHAQNSGQVQVRHYWRTSAGDAKIFKSYELKQNPENCFNVFFLIDNSCSISPAKVSVMETIMTLILNVIDGHSDVFPFLAAYRQNGTGKKVFLTKLFDGNTSGHKTRDFGKILYFKSEHVNYDPFALWEMLFVHRKHAKMKNRTNIVMLFGDAWPVSMEKDTRAEAQEIMDTIRKNYPNLIIIYFATNQMYKTEELGYDYYVNVNSEKFNLPTFVWQFQEVIEKILIDNEAA